MNIPFFILNADAIKSRAVILIIIAIIGIFTFIRLFSVIKAGFYFFRESFYRSGSAHYGSRTLENADVHLKQFIYYQKLSPRGKKEFLTRTLNFLNTKTIEGEDNYEPDYAAKIHVSAAATQLTFGLPDFPFDVFDTVILYPTIFKMGERAPLMKGATTLDGIIRISIKDFDEGFENPIDKLNVGLHELGHALFMEFLKKTSEEHEEEEDVHPIAKVVRPYLVESDKILNAGKSHHEFFRNYAFSNRHEFFAVSVEYFFEASAEFNEKFPELFKAMSHLLNQDPNNFTKDYVPLGR